ncbi:AAA+ ATPase domain-containing protein [Plasmodiophora brassicae]|uniref:AAA+ ATPase domain-containing protein n=1 Tax=Plasmodiophora brassicae TaxID=37360 RepID=A0A0G4IYW7_PLABS|nr:hypothetical protein PBRA_001607 [Plasmodiophora brassicae]SPQ93951.1 unnamed protein product [Plasmodiophora brassicae]
MYLEIVCARPMTAPSPLSHWLNVERSLQEAQERSNIVSACSNAVLLTRPDPGTRAAVDLHWARHLYLRHTVEPAVADIHAQIRKRVVESLPVSRLHQDRARRPLKLPNNPDRCVFDDIFDLWATPPDLPPRQEPREQPTRRPQIAEMSLAPPRPSVKQLPGFMTAAERKALDEAAEGRTAGRKRPMSPMEVEQPSKSGAGGNSRPLVSAPYKIPGKPRASKPVPGPDASESGFEMPENLQGLNLDPKLVEMILSDLMDKSPGVRWEDIAGLEFAKKCVREIVVWPMLRPDIFTGLRGPPKGLLLFGPPGTGKTMIGRAIASECGATFFSISASSLTSKWHGESEKLVRTLFSVARAHQPAVIFVDEIDSLLSQRSESEFEGSRRLKTEFLVQLDGAATCKDDRILLIGATNRPQELDDAARRRLVKRLYIPLPDADARHKLIRHLMKGVAHELTESDDMSALIAKTKGYSGADLTALCTEAAYGPIRSLPSIVDITPDQVRPVQFVDFDAALSSVRASVSSSDLEQYHTWNDQFGSFPIDPIVT